MSNHGVGKKYRWNRRDRNEFGACTEMIGEVVMTEMKCSRNWTKPKVTRLKILEPEEDVLEQMIKALKRVEEKPDLEPFAKNLKKLICEEIKLNNWGNS
jgi:hypothetical protein